MGLVTNTPPPPDNMVREFINYSNCRQIPVSPHYKWKEQRPRSLSQTNLFFDTREPSLSSLLRNCAIWSEDCGHGRVKASFEFELIHMLIYFKYPCITTGVFLAAQFVVPVASYFWWHNKIGQNIVLRFILASNFKKGKIPPRPRIFLIWMGLYLPSAISQLL